MLKKILSFVKEVAGNEIVVRSSLFSAGLATGFLVAKKIVEKNERARYEVLLEAELATTKDFYKKLYKKEEYSTPPELSEPVEKTENQTTSWTPATLYSLSHDRPESEEQPEEEPESEPEEDTPYPKTDEERTERLKELYDRGQGFKPEDMTLSWSIRIEQDEFLKNVHGFNQVSWTYFSEDDVMADEHNQYISDWKTMIDPDLVEVLDSDAVEETVMFVRNKDRKIEYMVTLDTGSYSSTLGITDHLEHGDKPGRGPKVRKFRSEDE